ncbi:alpha/beta fold hydrolase [Mycobacterium bourgelatii]|uniref:O-methylpimelyl-ACP methylesterase n=1 Tax=Mycobacterium bourgelatii TaxID=1273442 RepID=A0A7I9YJ99_MYCBU|nr:alpha/beta hydrolase [Mycobacterium bourgelatii]MCV6975556.1 alpha/beta hydrolase [Mycobacterium bourgelatii]GFG88573.1 O-methylpimelyl-ACP methylesterase [Mycobacterium bourgelatii]
MRLDAREVAAMERFSVPGPAGTVSGLRQVQDSEAEPVVFIHHINGAAHQWVPVMNHFNDRTTVAVDLRGHGNSQPGESYGVADYAADVEAAMDGLDIHYAHLVGASFGASVCLSIAAQAQYRIRSVAVIGGALTVADLIDPDGVTAELRELGSLAFFQKMAAVSFAPGTDAILLDEAARLAARNDPAVAESILREAFSADITDTATRVRAPALVLAGEHDQTCPPERAAVLADSLGTRCQVLAGRGHLAHLEDPALIARLVAAQLPD